MKYIVIIVSILISISAISYFTSGETFNVIRFQQWIELMQDPLVKPELVEIIELGDNWLAELIEMPINAIVEVKNFLSKFIAGFINVIWAAFVMLEY